MELPNIIGSTCRVTIVGHVNSVPAKTDTGADSSSIWASSIFVDASGVLNFELFAPGSQYYTGEVIKTTDYSAARVRSSNGHSEIRYRVRLPIRIEGRRVRALVNLSDRSKNKYPILIGRRTIAGKFLVDVARGVDGYKPVVRAPKLNAELQADPHGFYRKYHAIGE